MNRPGIKPTHPIFPSRKAIRVANDSGSKTDDTCQKVDMTHCEGLKVDQSILGLS